MTAPHTASPGAYLRKRRLARITLIATGGVRAATHLELAERFLGDGHEVRCIATRNALAFLVRHLLRHPRTLLRYLRCYRPQVRHRLAFWIPRPGRVPHVSEAAWADVIVMAPASCNSIGKLAAGITDNLPLLVLRATPRWTRVVVVPSMNTEMWHDPFFQRCLDVLNRTDKYKVLSPTRGQMLQGERGFGAQVALGEIVRETYRALGDIAEGDSAAMASTPADFGTDSGHATPDPGIVLVDEDEDLREELALTLSREHADVPLMQFSTASEALTWLRGHSAAVVLTELEFSNGVSGFELVEQLRRPGPFAGAHVIVTSSRDGGRGAVERLARQDVHFQPKPLNTTFVAGLVAGCLRGSAERDFEVRRRSLKSDEVLFREGEQSSWVYVVEAGRLRVVKQAGGDEFRLNTVEPGGIVGEMAFLDASPRAATAIADCPTEVVAFDLERVRDYVERQPAWLGALIRSLTEHIRRADSWRTEHAAGEIGGRIDIGPDA